MERGSLLIVSEVPSGWMSELGKDVKEDSSNVVVSKIVNTYLIRLFAFSLSANCI